MDNKTKLTILRVRHSQLAELDPPRAVNHAITGWIQELERDVRSGVLADEVNVSDSAEVELINVRGPKQ